MGLVSCKGKGTFNNPCFNANKEFRISTIHVFAYCLLGSRVYSFRLVLQSARTGFSRFCIVRCVFWCCGGEISLGKITVDDACTSATDVIVLVFSCKPSKTIYIKSYYSAVSRLPRDEYQESTPFSPSGHRPHASLSWVEWSNDPAAARTECDLQNPR